MEWTIYFTNQTDVFLGGFFAMIVKPGQPVCLRAQHGHFIAKYKANPTRSRSAKLYNDVFF